VVVLEKISNGRRAEEASCVEFRPQPGLRVQWLVKYFRDIKVTATERRTKQRLCKKRGNFLQLRMPHEQTMLLLMFSIPLCQMDNICFH
jgi:hypothetical protein